MGWVGLALGYLCLVIWLALFNTSGLLFLMLGGTRLQLIFVVGSEVFRGGPLLDVFGSLQLLNSAHVRDRDKALLRSVMVGGVWNWFLLGGSGVSLFHVGSVVLLMVMVIFFGNVPFLLLLRFVKILSFMIS